MQKPNSKGLTQKPLFPFFKKQTEAKINTLFTTNLFLRKKNTFFGNQKLFSKISRNFSLKLYFGKTLGQLGSRTKQPSPAFFCPELD
jgi:hypothetical protein